VQSGWDDEPHSFTGQQNFADGRIFVVGDKPKRKSRKRADYLLRVARDLIIVDECHRGSARDESNWREILEYFQPAYQLGMTAAPLRDDNRDTYAYFGDPSASHCHRCGCRRLEADAGREGSLRLRDSGWQIPDQGFRAGDRPAGAHRGHRPSPGRVHEKHGSISKARCQTAAAHLAAELAGHARRRRMKVEHNMNRPETNTLCNRTIRA